MVKTKKPKQISLIETPRNYAIHNLILDRWTEPQIRMLQSIFQTAKTSIEGLDYQSFLRVFPLLERFPAEIRLAAFKAFLPPKKQAIGFREFCLTLSQIVHSNRDEQAAFLFKIFDLDLDHELNLTEFQTLVTSCTPYLRSQDSATVEDNVPMNAEKFRLWAQSNLSLEDALNCFEIVPTPEEERRVIHSQSLRLDETPIHSSVFLLLKRWWDAWTAYVKYNEGPTEGKSYPRTTSTIVGDRPIEIDNSDLLSETSTVELRAGMREGRDFIVVSEAVWSSLANWYGGGPAIRRLVVAGKGGGREVDIYPQMIKTHIYTKRNITRPAFYIILAPSFTSTDIESSIRSELHLKGSEPVRYWVKSASDYQPLSEFERSYMVGKELVVELGEVVGGKTFWLLDQKSQIEGDWREFRNGMRVDVQRAPNLWVEAIVISSTESHVKLKLIRDNRIEEFPKTSEDLSAPGTKIAAVAPLSGPSLPGAKGVANLGNTCYLSCILQCVSNTPLLKDYLRTKQNYGLHINMKNPQGFKGAMAMEVCTVVHDLWESRRPVISPVVFHKTLSKYFPQFVGHQQHDCHELLNVLLDSLHQDLSRGLSDSHISAVTIKNPVPGQCEREAEEQWKELQGSQGSAITDLMGGQTRTTIKCKGCGHTSVLFELFMNLALPIPVSMQQAYFCSVFPVSGKVVKYGVILTKGATVDALVTKIAEVVQMPKDTFLLGDVYYHRINTFYAPGTLDTLRKQGIHSRTELVVYETAASLESYDRHITNTVKPVEECESGDRVDLKVEGDIWVSASVITVKSTSQSKELSLSYFYKEASSQWIDTKNPFLSPYRSHSRQESDRILRFYILHRKAGNETGVPEIFGMPFIVTIGSWLTYQDLVQLVIGKLNRFIRPQSKKPSMTSPNFITQTLKLDEQSRLDSQRRPFTLKILNRIGSHCYNCGPKCPGCDFPIFKNTLSALNLQTYFSIGVDWVSNAYLLDEFEDESVLPARELDTKNMSPLDIDVCVNEFTKEEEFESVCETCKFKGMTMKMDIWRLPDILILNLKRFAYVSGVSEKIDQLVDYPLLALDMSTWVKREKRGGTGFTQSTTALQRAYDLYAVVFHSGSMESGHYTTCCMHEHEGRTRWLLYDDDQVFQVVGDVSKSVVSRNAYLLFFRRRKMSTSNLVNLTCLA